MSSVLAPVLCKKVANRFVCQLVSQLPFIHWEIIKLSHETRAARRLHCFRLFEEGGLAIGRVDGGMP